LAGELAVRELEASRLRARLRGFSVCSNGPVPQKLPGWRSTYCGTRRKTRAPRNNTPAYFTADHDKQAFREWKRALESYADARLISRHSMTTTPETLPPHGRKLLATDPDVVNHANGRVSE
jgi:hypothetical protein